ncbi:MAG: SRPBCC family protein [Nocardioides sp.]
MTTTKRYPCELVTPAFFGTAPIRMVATVDISATAAEVWTALEDAAAWPRWVAVIKAVEWTSPRPFQVGTTRTVRMSGNMTAYEEFIEWELHSRMSFRFNEASMQGVSAFAERYLLEQVTPGSTRLTWVMAMQPSGISKLIVGGMRLPGQLLLTRMLRRLRRLVESEYAAAER